jgi:hypothetical protein
LSHKDPKYLVSFYLKLYISLLKIKALTFIVMTTDLHLEYPLIEFLRMKLGDFAPTGCYALRIMYLCWNIYLNNEKIPWNKSKLLIHLNLYTSFTVLSCPKIVRLVCLPYFILVNIVSRMCWKFSQTH